MVNYKEAIIYKLCAIGCDKFYIGSTTNFRRRKYLHKSICNNSNSKDYNRSVYKFIRQNGGFENWSMIQIESYEAKNKRDLETRERYYIDLLQPELNKIIPTRTQQEYSKEYYESNKDILNQKHKEYYDQNREHFSQKITCECGTVVCKRHISRHKNSIRHIRWFIQS